MANTSMFGTRRSGIIFAADLGTPDDNFRVLDLIAGHVDVVKLASPLVYQHGIRVIRLFKERYGLPVFADLKIADVPHTDARIVELIRDNGGSAAMIHGFVGPDALELCIEAAGPDVGLIMQLELTNPGGRMFTAPIAEDMAKLARDLGLFGVQAPGNRPDRIARIREVVGPEATVVCCGVGAQGGTLPEVFASGGTYGIVGRAIYASDDPLAAVTGLSALAPAGR
ncbi:orotidine-5'-phosphate decarboxylase [Nonomuraea sp. NPDC050691]|uniref:orotidine-5'-phosphate decarboxylase n=1 Tax=Nonomuraea sp. NPDC050691 TaxID=3155661 RepID=UPI0033F18092